MNQELHIEMAACAVEEGEQELAIRELTLEEIGAVAGGPQVTNDTM